MIRISKSLSRSSETHVITCKDDFLKGKIIIKKSDDAIEFIKPTPCYNGRTYTFTRFGICYTTIELPLGIFQYTIDNDKLIVEL
jgi:hypothetical protein